MGTPERKKKLRLLLRKKAAEELKKEQERKAAERRRIIEERCGQPKNLDDASEEEIVNLLNEFHQRICRLEFAKYDMEFEVRKKDFEINELNFRDQLKQVKKKEFTMEEEDKEKKPDWSKKGGEGEKKVKDGDGEDSGAEA